MGKLEVLISCFIGFLPIFLMVFIFSCQKIREGKKKGDKNEIFNGIYGLTIFISGLIVGVILLT